MAQRRLASLLLALMLAGSCGPGVKVYPACSPDPLHPQSPQQYGKCTPLPTGIQPSPR